MSYVPKIGDVLEYKASDMVGGQWTDETFKCRIVSLIFQAGKLVGQGIMWETDEERFVNPKPKVLLNQHLFGRSATPWIDKGKKL